MSLNVTTRSKDTLRYKLVNFIFEEPSNKLCPYWRQLVASFAIATGIGAFALFIAIGAVCLLLFAIVPPLRDILANMVFFKAAMSLGVVLWAVAIVISAAYGLVQLYKRSERFRNFMELRHKLKLNINMSWLKNWCQKLLQSGKPVNIKEKREKRDLSIRLMDYYDFPYDDTIPLTRYIVRVITIIAILIFSLAFALMIATTILFLPIHSWYTFFTMESFEALTNNQQSRLILGMLISAIEILVLTVVGVKYISRNVRNKVETSDNIIMLRIRAWHDKICPYIEFK